MKVEGKHNYKIKKTRREMARKQQRDVKIGFEYKTHFSVFQFRIPPRQTP